MSNEPASPSGLPLDLVYRANGAGEAPTAPGEFPFVRGIHPGMYRDRLWTMRQYAGFGTAEQTNARFRDLLAAGQTGLSTAFDLPTQMGYDSDNALAEGEVGRAGVAIDTVDDLARLFDDIPLDRVSTSMTINATAGILLAMYIVVAEERGIEKRKLRGTIQNDVLKEYAARGTYIFPIEPSLRWTTDILRFVARENMNFNPISLSGYHMREAGSTAVQEVAYTFANALEYLDRCVAAGLDINVIGPRLSFFFAAHNDLFEEVAKFRAARRLWATLMRSRYAADDRSCVLRFHTQTGGSTLTAQQPLTNVVRVAYQALAAVLGGTQSLHTNSYDEALALPTANAARLALRTQQVLAFESGVPKTADPLGGSYYVESLTSQFEQGVRDLLDVVAGWGGAAAAIDQGKLQDAIARSAYREQRSVEAGERIVVGVNRFVDEEPPLDVDAPDYSALAQAQQVRLRQARLERDNTRCQGALAAVRQAAAGSDLITPRLIEAVRARATVGEISNVLRDVWGTYDAG